MMTLREVTPNRWTNGIFHALQALDVPWSDEDIADQLDILYYGNHSGRKLISPLVFDMLTDGELTPETMAQLAQVCVSLYGVNWAKEYATLSLEYNPIENYNRHEVMKDDTTEKEYGHTNTRTDNLTDTRNGSETDTANQVVTAETKTSGFNSAEYQPNTQVITTPSGNGDVHAYNAVTDAHTGTQTDRESGKDTETRNYTLDTSGNIGVTTSQQMLESEREVWKWNFFEDVVFPAVDRVLTISVY